MDNQRYCELGRMLVQNHRRKLTRLCKEYDKALGDGYTRKAENIAFRFQHDTFQYLTALEGYFLKVPASGSIEKELGITQDKLRSE